MNYFNISINEALEEKRNLNNAIKQVIILVATFSNSILVRSPKDIGAAYNQEAQTVPNKI